ncbi:MAG: PilW family protein [Alcanivoracaceae bacterium]|nr:PilW family protein [Alcanivoracaceae bacterium]
MKYKNYQSGFSIVELMIAVFIGLIILTGLVTVFETTATMNRTQNGLARLQENGRFITLQLKNALDQAGYQYCLSSVGAEEKQIVGIDPLAIEYENLSSKIQPWRVLDNQEVFPGVPAGPFFDPRHFIHGHECGANSCLPDFTSAGTDMSYLIPTIGVGDGDRIAGTDVLTVRYLHGPGKAVSNIVDRAELAVTQTLQYEFYESSNPDAQFPVANTPVLIASCSITEPHVVTTIIAGGTGTATFSSPGSTGVTNRVLTRVFDLNRDMRSITYYVANNVVNDRDTPTLYSVANGTVNALIEGVDRFDILYTVQTATKGNYLVLDAQGVDAMDITSCTAATDDLPNTPGCGWRSVVSIEFHLLLNTIHDSSSNENEAFFYSIDGDQAQSPEDLLSQINHYRLHRREFYSVVATKNWN